MFFITGINCTAQNEKLLSYGVRVGFSLPVLTIDYQPATQYRLAPVAGIYIQARFLPWVAVSCDMLYTQYGGNNIDPTTIYTPVSPILDNLYNTNLRIHSIEIPIGVKLGLPDLTGNIKPFVSLGGSLAFSLQAYANNYFYNEVIPNYPILQSSRDIVTSAVNAVDYSFMTSTGVDFQAAKLNFCFEVYYRLGLRYINYNQKTYAPDYRANAFGLKIGIGI